MLQTRRDGDALSATPDYSLSSTTPAAEGRVLSFAELKELIEQGKTDQIPNNEHIPDDLNVRCELLHAFCSSILTSLVSGKHAERVKCKRAQEALGAPCRNSHCMMSTLFLPCIGIIESVWEGPNVDIKPQMIAENNDSARLALVFGTSIISMADSMGAGTRRASTACNRT